MNHSRIPILILLVLFMFAESTVIAGDRLRYYVFHSTKTAKLDYEKAFDFTIYDPTNPSPTFTFRTSYLIHGCTQESFTYTEEDCQRKIAPERLTKLLAAIREIPLEKLESKRKFGHQGEWSSGSLELNGTNHTLSGALDQPDCAKLHSLILALVDEAVPKADRQTKTRTIEGDLVPARPVTFAELLGDPVKFDGKRVQLIGYYGSAFEYSNLGPTKTADLKQSVWLGSLSTLTKPFIPSLNTFVSAEGTFDAGAGGHMGVWPGQLDRVTRVVKTKQ